MLDLVNACVLWIGNVWWFDWRKLPQIWTAISNQKLSRTQRFDSFTFICSGWFNAVAIMIRLWCVAYRIRFIKICLKVKDIFASCGQRHSVQCFVYQLIESERIYRNVYERERMSENKQLNAGKNWAGRTDGRAEERKRVCDDACISAYYVTWHDMV